MLLTRQPPRIGSTSPPRPCSAPTAPTASKVHAEVLRVTALWREDVAVERATRTSRHVV